MQWVRLGGRFGQVMDELIVAHEVPAPQHAAPCIAGRQPRDDNNPPAMSSVASAGTITSPTARSRSRIPAAVAVWRRRERADMKRARSRGDYLELDEADDNAASAALARATCSAAQGLSAYRSMTPR